MVEAGIISAKGGKVRLLKPPEISKHLQDRKDGESAQLTHWTIMQTLCHLLTDSGEEPTANFLAQVGDKAYIIKELAYYLYNICDHKGWAQEAIPYNSLVVAWAEINWLAEAIKENKVIQTSLL